MADILAKSDGETLHTHTWHVLSRFADLARARPTLPILAGRPRLWHDLYWACWLHDFGKVATGFQESLRGQAARRWPYRHEVGSLAFTAWLSADGRDGDDRWLVAAIASHHKDANVIAAQYKPDGPAIRDIVGELTASPLAALWKWFDEWGVRWIHLLELDDLGIEALTIPPRDEAIALVRDQGVARIERALATYRRFVRDLEDPKYRARAIATLALRGGIITADHSASAHIGPSPTLPRASYARIIEHLGRFSAAPHEHQSASAAANGNAVLIAPTGSGKTEAALLWAFGDRPRRVPRLFYALPYQASMNAMYERLERLFPGHVGLQHGRALQAIYRVYVEESDERGIAFERAKDHQNRTALNHYPIRVFSPYQMLKACYRLRGYESILSDYFEAAFIFDEIHAYEPKRLALVLRLVSYLRLHFGARFFFMSATMPRLITTVLREALGDYQLVSASDQLFATFRRHRLYLLEGDMLEPANLARIVARAAAGDSVLVCCNTVARAQEVWRRVREELGSDATVELLHGRLNGRDRLTRERRIREDCGRNSVNRRPVVLIATQVVEVSLDIDLDTLFSDPAPLEALIQRFGRINRTGRLELAPVHVFRQPIPEQNNRPYDLRLLHAALQLLEEQDAQPINEQLVTTWLNRIYEELAGDYAHDWRHTYEQTATEFDDLLRTLVAFNADRDLEAAFYRAFDSIEVLPVTFESEYFTLMTDRQFVAAGELLVSISYWQYAMLANRGRLRAGDRKAEDPLERISVVTTRYDADLGLLFDD